MAAQGVFHVNDYDAPVIDEALRVFLRLVPHPAVAFVSPPAETEAETLHPPRLLLRFVTGSAGFLFSDGRGPVRRQDM